jgi:4-hydroxybenzoate polyprenyltransferase
MSLRPLCVDLDGTLVKTNTLYEAVIALIRARPIVAFLLPYWLMRGQSYLWQRLSERASINVALLPYRQEVLDYLRREKERGREIALVSGSHHTVVEKVAHHLGLFDRFLGSNESVHLIGLAKLSAILKLYEKRHFDYIGDTSADLSIWRMSDHAVIVSGDNSLVKRLTGVNVNTEHITPNDQSWLKALFKAMRVYQWSKNLLLFAAAFLSHNFANLTVMISAAHGFVAFSLCASAVYIMNDLFDLESDRLHTKKRYRPFAAGDLSLAYGGMFSIFLLILALVIAFALSPKFAAGLSIYFAMTFSYSFYFKKKLLVDVFLLAGLYTIRVWAGGICAGVIISNWTLAFFMSLSLSLAIAKRYSELAASADAQKEVKIHRRSYQTSDMPFLLCLGCINANISVLVIALYIASKDSSYYYTNPSALWLICPAVAYWVGRLWMLTIRGKLNEDPVLFAIKDKVSYLLGAFIVTTVIFAI